MYHNIISYTQQPLAPTYLYRRMYPNIQSYIIKNSGTIEDAEDIFQEAVLQLLEKTNNNTFHIRTNMSSYFFGICKNLWKSQLRKQKTKTHYIIFGNYIENNVLESIENSEKEQLFQSYFIKMKGSAKQIWDLFLEGKDTSEIAYITGLSEGYIRKKKCESKKSLTQMIRQDPLFIELQNTQSKITWD